MNTKQLARLIEKESKPYRGSAADAFFGSYGVAINKQRQSGRINVKRALKFAHQMAREAQSARPSANG